MAGPLARAGHVLDELVVDPLQQQEIAHVGLQRVLKAHRAQRPAGRGGPGGGPVVDAAEHSVGPGQDVEPLDAADVAGGVRAIGVKHRQQRRARPNGLEQAATREPEITLHHFVLWGQRVRGSAGGLSDGFGYKRGAPRLNCCFFDEKELSHFGLHGAGVGDREPLHARPRAPSLDCSRGRDDKLRPQCRSSWQEPDVRDRRRRPARLRGSTERAELDEPRGAERDATIARTPTMGADRRRRADPASVSGFRLDKYQVTVGRFRQFVAASVAGWRPAAGSGKHAHLNGGQGLAEQRRAGLRTRLGSRGHQRARDDQRPIGWRRLNCEPSFQTWTDAAGPARDAADQLRRLVRGLRVLHLGRGLPAERSGVGIRGGRRRRAARVSLGRDRSEHGCRHEQPLLDLGLQLPARLRRLHGRRQHRARRHGHAGRGTLGPARSGRRASRSGRWIGTRPTSTLASTASTSPTSRTGSCAAARSAPTPRTCFRRPATATSPGAATPSTVSAARGARRSPLSRFVTSWRSLATPGQACRNIRRIKWGAVAELRPAVPRPATARRRAASRCAPSRWTAGPWPARAPWVRSTLPPRKVGPELRGSMHGAHAGAS